MSKHEANTNGATIVIRLNGDETVASILDDQFGIGCTGQAVAKRNPKDEYDAYTGARVALDRLFRKDFFEEHQEDDEPKRAAAPKKTSEPKFQVGDTVRVTNASITFSRYKDGDVAVVTKVVPPIFSWHRTVYEIKVRSKERKGSEGVAFAEELTLLHRAKGAERR